MGKAMALGFAALGANIAICGRRADILDSAAQEISAHGTQVQTVVCDVRQMDAVQDMMQAVFARFGTVSGLINNAAGNFICPTEALSANAFDAVVKIVLNGTFNCTQAVGKQWIAQKSGGRILNICTTYAWTGSAFVVPSACAKAGVLAMTQSLAVEWGKYNIQLNAMAPGPFQTDAAWKNLMVPGFEDKLRAKNPMKRLANMSELLNLAVLLMSDAAPYINGDCITIDGGEWLQGAGQFNGLLELSPQDWQSLQQQARSK